LILSVADIYNKRLNAREKYLNKQLCISHISNEYIVLGIIVVQFEITQIITIFIGNRHIACTYHRNLRNKRYHNGPRNRLRRTYDTLNGENIIIICYVLGIIHK